MCFYVVGCLVDRSEPAGHSDEMQKTEIFSPPSSTMSFFIRSTPPRKQITSLRPRNSNHLLRRTQFISYSSAVNHSNEATPPHLSFQDSRSEWTAHKAQMTFDPADTPQEFSSPFKLRTKTPSESRITKTLAFSTDHDLREAYLSFHGSIRIGKILEDLDSMAGLCAYKHSEGFHPQHQLTIVTAAVDRISLLRPIVPYWDLQFESNIIWTGRSSMLVRIDVTQARPNGGPSNSVMVALFSMVAREKYNDVAAPVHQLEPVTEREEELFRFGEEHAQLRKERRKERFEIAPPNDEERDLLHNMWLKETAKPKKIGELNHTSEPDSEHASMPSTRLNSTRIMMPQRRNIHNKIFGGYLLREAFELSWAVCYAHTKGNAPTWLSMDENMFVQPVEIGSLISFSAEIVYSEKKMCVIRVDADVMHPHLNTVERTNVFHFTFQSSIPKQVMPYTYDESIRYLEGRRIAKKGMELQQRMRVKQSGAFV